jgi:hypothetical protein
MSMIYCVFMTRASSSRLQNIQMVSCSFIYVSGIMLMTYFSGRRVRVILVAVCCDHPAMCKVCGFGNHSKKEGFCSHCHIPQSELKTEDAMEYDSKAFHACRR